MHKYIGYKLWIVGVKIDTVCVQTVRETPFLHNGYPLGASFTHFIHVLFTGFFDRQFFNKTPINSEFCTLCAVPNKTTNLLKKGLL